MRKLITVLLGLSFLVILLFGCAQKNDEGKTGIPNPASQYCEKQGYTLTIITDQNSNQYGICKFNDGTECEEWDYFRGNCKPGDTKIAVPVDEDQCKSLGGEWGDPSHDIGKIGCNLPTKDAGNSCTDGSQCDAGLCVTETPTSTAGKCPSWKMNTGCINILGNGKNAVICID